MKFTDSLVVELPVRDALLSIQQGNGSMHVGTSVWPCSLVLVKFIDRWHPHTFPASTPAPNPDAALFDFRNKHVVELALGCGVAGMGLHLLGYVILTDISPVMPALKRNLKRNKPVLGKNLKIAQIHWNNKDQIAALAPSYDFVGTILLGYQLWSPEAHQLFSLFILIQFGGYKLFWNATAPKFGVSVQHG